MRREEKERHTERGTWIQRKRQRDRQRDNEKDREKQIEERETKWKGETNF